MIFAMVGLIAVALVKAIGLAMGNGIGLLGTNLSEHLSVGVCQEWCFYDGFVNKIK